MLGRRVQRTLLKEAGQGALVGHHLGEARGGHCDARARQDAAAAPEQCVGCVCNDAGHGGPLARPGHGRALALVALVVPVAAAPAPAAMVMLSLS